MVSRHQGLDTRRGPIGAANSVNAAVVEVILLLTIVSVTMSQLYFVLFSRAGL